MHNITVVKLSSQRIVFNFSGIMVSGKWFQDLNQAYVQSDELLKREIYLRPSKSLRLPEKMFWRILSRSMASVTLVTIGFLLSAII